MIRLNLKVYDLLVREVATLVNEEKPAGSYEIEFDGSSHQVEFIFINFKLKIILHLLK